MWPAPPVAGILMLVFLGGHPALAQLIAVGVKGGVRITDDFSGQPNGLIRLTSESKRYIVGPMLEVRLPLRLSFEFDALYQRFGFTSITSGGLAYSMSRQRVNSWEFPMILRYRPPAVGALPFVGVGYAPRTAHGTDVSSGFYLSSPCCYTYYSSQRSHTSYPVTHGVVISGGADLGIGHVRVSPELRYVHWSAPFLNISYRGFGFVSNQDELLLLLGVSWH